MSSEVFGHNPKITREVYAVIETNPIAYPGLESSLFISAKLTEGLEKEVATYDTVEPAKAKMEEVSKTLSSGCRAFVAARGYGADNNLVDIHWFI